MTQVVTRFAPSPTGFLHIGGARTALFNWLYAKRLGGTFLLRIEDTDRERSTEAAVEAIIDGLKWLGLDWDGEAISQFERAERHREVAYQLLAVRRRLSLLRQHRGARGDAREGAPRGQADALRRPLARPRPGARAARRYARHPPQGAGRRARR